MSNDGVSGERQWRKEDDVFRSSSRSLVSRFSLTSETVRPLQMSSFCFLLTHGENPFHFGYLYRMPLQPTKLRGVDWIQY